jgi:hypothetical protein
MTTSGITVNQLSRDDIINAAYRKISVIGLGQTANTTQITDGAAALNTLVAEFRTLGMSIWARKSYDLVLVTSQQDYTMGVGQTLNFAYPLKIYTANLLQPPAFDTKIIVNPLSFTDFSLLPNGSTGVPVNYTYQPKVNLGVFSVWPIPDSSVTAGTKIRLQYQSPFEYFNAAVDTPDFPEEWNNALIYNLAMLLSDENNVPLQKKQWIEKQADKHLATALSAGTEESSFYIQRDWAGYGNYGNPS